MLVDGGMAVEEIGQGRRAPGTVRLGGHGRGVACRVQQDQGHIAHHVEILPNRRPNSFSFNQLDNGLIEIKSKYLNLPLQSQLLNCLRGHSSRRVVCHKYPADFRMGL